MYKLKIENGYYLFKLEDLLKSKNISINKLMKDTETDFKVVKRIMTGELVRLIFKAFDVTDDSKSEKIFKLFLNFYDEKITTDEIVDKIEEILK